MIQTITARRRTVAATTILACLLLSAAAASAQGGFPAIKVEPQSLDFGTLVQQEARVQTVTITNEGGAELVIDNVESTCGCTVAAPAADRLAPGASTTMEVSFNSKTFQGNQVKMVRVHTNDPAEPVLEIPVTAFVKVPLVFNPGNKMLGFGSARAAEAGSRMVNLQSTDKVALEITPIRVDESIFEITIKGGKTHLPWDKDILVTVRDDVPPGVIREILTFGTNVPEVPTFDLEVSGRSLADVELFPAKHNFRYVRRDQAMTRMFQLKMPEGYGLKVTEATIDLPGFQVTEVVKSEHTGFINITIEGTPLPNDDPRAVEAKGRMKGVLRVVTDQPELPVFEADIMYLLRI